MKAVPLAMEGKVWLPKAGPGVVTCGGYVCRKPGVESGV